MRPFIPFILTLCLLASCSEVDEPTVYDDWEGNNTVYIDSIAALAGDRLVPFTGSGSIVDAYPTGQMFGLQTTASTTERAQYVYCKKLSANPDGQRPIYTESVSAFYYGTYITGDSFDGNFTGYTATDRGTLDAETNAPTAFDSPTTFSVSGVIAGWTAALQYMHVGERWMLYVPYQSAYGTSSYNGIPGYSALTFDIVLEGVE